MRIKIYNVVGLGFIVGEKIDLNKIESAVKASKTFKAGSGDDGKIYLEYPGMLILNQQTPQGGLQHLMVEPIPDVFAGKDDFLKQFPIKKKDIVLSGKPVPDIIELYSKYRGTLVERITGIKVVRPGFDKTLPKIGPKGRIIT